MPPGSPEARAADAAAAPRPSRRTSLRREHREAADELAAVGRRLIAREDYGAGPQGSPAAAFGTVTRAVEAVQRMQREAYGIAAGGRQVAAVILLPVPASTVEDWARLSARTLGVAPARRVEETREGYTVVEAEVLDAPAGGDSDQ